jgi:uncharacterized peroxidase-related enzyme
LAFWETLEAVENRMRGRLVAFQDSFPEEIVMPQILPLSETEAPPVSRDLFKDLQAKMGMVPNIFRTMGHAPEVLQATLNLNAAIQKNLPPKLRELAYLRTSQINGCNYCLHYHKMLGKKAGVSDVQINELANYESSAAFTDLDKAALRFAEQWTKSGKVDKGVLERLARDLTPSQLVTLAATVALANWTNRFNEIMGIELP